VTVVQIPPLANPVKPLNIYTVPPCRQSNVFRYRREIYEYVYMAYFYARGGNRMSTESEVRRKITLTEDEETGLWSAVDEEEGVASQGETRVEALENLDEAVALHKGEIGEPVTDEDLREWGIDPDEASDEVQEPDVPWFDG